MPNKIFLEDYPLYKKFKTDWNGNRRYMDLEKPAIHMYCNLCKSEQTFNQINEFYEHDGQNDITKIVGNIVGVKYQCSACKKYHRQFFIRFLNEKNISTNDNGEKTEYDCVAFEKIGQYPSWSIKMDKELEKMLVEHSEDYKKGLTCESQSYGIGAYAYFRRIAENIIDELLNSIYDLIEDEAAKEEYKKALDEVKKQKNADKKINLVKHLLPKSLQIDGFNPLGALYNALSVGLHGETDEECMEQAEIIKKVLIYLVNQIVRTKNAKKEFSEDLKRLLSKS